MTYREQIGHPETCLGARKGGCCRSKKENGMSCIEARVPITPTFAGVGGDGNRIRPACGWVDTATYRADWVRAQQWLAVYVEFSCRDTGRRERLEYSIALGVAADCADARRIIDAAIHRGAL